MLVSTPVANRRKPRGQSKEDAAASKTSDKSNEGEPTAAAEEKTKQGRAGLREKKIAAPSVDTVQAGIDPKRKLMKEKNPEVENVKVYMKRRSASHTTDVGPATKKKK